MAAVLGAAALSFATASAVLAAPPKVAVFSQPGFPYYGVPALISPKEIAADLEKAGVTADLLDADAVADPKRLNAARFAAVVLPYGNAYPREAFANLRAFHKAGGSLVLSGIPFTHAVVRNTGDAAKQDPWTDQGHDSDPALFGPDGIGAGGFAGPDGTVTEAALAVSTGDPWHLRGLLSASDAADLASSQWLDTASLPAGARVQSAMTLAGKPLMALVTHQGDGFDGAVDAWTYRGPQESDRAAYLCRQLMERGTVAALTARGLLGPAQARTAFAALGALPAPRPYENVVLPTPPRPYAIFQPKMPPLARHLYAADVRHLSHDEQVLLITLQGIVNRKQPRIYLIFDDDDQFWLAELRRQKETDAPVPVSDPLSLVSRFRSEFKGAVVPDPNVYDSPVVAVSLAGVDDLIVATPELAARLKLPIKADLRGKFKDDVDALHYLRTQVAPRANPYLTCSLNPQTFSRGALDQIVAARGTVFWITGPKAQTMLPGANQAGEMEEVKAFLASLPLGAIVRGFWWCGEGMGLVEDEGVALGSRFGKVTVVTDLINNLSVHSGVRATKLAQKPRPPAPALDKSKVYVSFTMSDGDNLCTWRGYFRHYFQDPARGTVPIGWGMGPTLIDVAPDWARYYYEQATPNDEFICDVSGVGYIYPPSWGTALKDRGAAFRWFYGLTQTYMGRMDMKTVRLMHVGAPDIAQVGQLMPDVSFLMPDYGYSGEKTYRELTYTLPDTGQAVFRAATNGKGPENLAGQIRQRAGSARPAFVNAFIWNWGSTPSDLKKVLDLLGPEYIAVTPSQMNTLYRESRQSKKDTAQQNAPAVRTTAR